MSYSELVSIIVPTYNHSHFLKSAIESVLIQTYTNWELIIIDNNSTDNTNEILKQYNDNRIKVYKVNNNGVIAVSRNMGIDLARGTWIAFLDSDDCWTADKLKICIDRLNDKTDIAFHDLSIIGESPTKFRSKILRGKQPTFPVTNDLLINGNFICNSSVVVKRSLLEKIGKIDESIEMIASEDYNTWLKISQLSEKFLYIPETLGFYMVHPGGISKKNMAISMRIACSDFLYLLNQSERNYYEGRLAYVEGNYFLSQKKYSLALIEFKKSLRLGKTEIKLKSTYFIFYIFIQLFIFRNSNTTPDNLEI